MKKTITATIFFGIFLFIILYLRQISIMFFDALIMFFLIACTIEMTNCLKKQGYNVIKTPLYISAILVYPIYLIFGLAGVIFTIIICFFVGATIATFKYNNNEDKGLYSIKDYLATAFVFFYPIMIISTVFDINRFGLMAIFSVVLYPTFADMFAQWIGSTMGKRKLCPKISPKKTVAGSVGSFVGAMIAGSILCLTFEGYNLFDNFKNVGMTAITNSVWTSLPVYLVIGLIVGATAQLGDLFASWLKRQLNVKDFGGFLPGHGGLMDRADSIMYSAPFIFFVFTIIQKFQA